MPTTEKTRTIERPVPTTPETTPPSSRTARDTGDRPRPRHFSMIRDFTMADFFTLGNGFSGMAAILATMKYLITGDARLIE